jgi:outer membrane protein assembly factor BamA
MRAWLLLGLVVVPLSASAQARPPQSLPEPNPLKDILVTGNKRFTAAQIVAASGLTLGRTVSKELFDAARTRLMATGAFESVGYGFRPNAALTGYDGTLDVAEVALMYRYRFEELTAPDETLRAMLRKQETLLGDEIPARTDVLERYNRALTGFFEGKVEVVGRLSYAQPGEPTILFRPAGDRPRVSQIHFTGYDAIPAKQLFTKFSDAAVGTEYSEASIRRLLDSAIVPIYEAKGRLRVAFPKITVEPTREPEVVGVAVTVAIDEGAVYNLGAVRYAGAAAPQAKELEKLVKWRKDETANFDEINAGLKSITRHFRNSGYLRAATRADRTVNDKDHTVDLLITVDQGALFTYGKLDVRGLDLIGEPAIRKMWGAKEGKPFDADYPDAFLKDVRDQRMFDNLGPTTAETKVNEDSKTVDVTLSFAPAKPAEIERRKLRPPSPVQFAR